MRVGCPLCKIVKFLRRCHYFVLIAGSEFGGQLQTETMDRPGRLGLWILGKKVNTQSSRSVTGEIFCSGEQFLFS